jgi:hypothetical protein
MATRFLWASVAAGLGPDRVAVFGDRLAELALLIQDYAEVVVGLDEVGLRLNRAAEFGDR